MAGRLRIDTIRMATAQEGRTRRRMEVAVMFGFGSLIDIGALLYALIH
jgi:hypothetical protein